MSVAIRLESIKVNHEDMFRPGEQLLPLLITVVSHFI
jgi:hypothetical protein